MPVCTCTTKASTLSADVKAPLARGIAEIHSAINHVPSTYVNVVFHDLPIENVYTAGAPASPVLVTGWVRAGHPDSETTRLVTQIAAAVSQVSPPIECLPSSKAVQPDSRLRAVACYPNQATNHHGLGESEMPGGSGGAL